MSLVGARISSWKWNRLQFCACARVHACVRACVRVCVFRIVSVDKILRFTNTLIIIITKMIAQNNSCIDWAAKEQEQKQSADGKDKLQAACGTFLSAMYTLVVVCKMVRLLRVLPQHRLSISVPTMFKWKLVCLYIFWQWVCHVQMCISVPVTPVLVMSVVSVD